MVDPVIENVYAIYFNGKPHPNKDKLPVVYASHDLAKQWLKAKREAIEEESAIAECKEYDDWRYAYIYAHFDETYHAFNEYRIVEIPVKGEL
jgi:hypothetical protein